MINGHRRKFIGNGAYTLSDWNVNERLVLKRNPKYWNDKETVIEQATFLPIQSETSDINRYRAGEIDVTNSAVPPVLFTKLKKIFRHRSGFPVFMHVLL